MIELKTILCKLLLISCRRRELPSHIFDEMKHFFSVYKALENKTTAVDELGGKEEAKRIIEKSLKNYKEKRQELLNI